MTSKNNILSINSYKGEFNKAVYIVGAGPGNPDLLTLKAYKLIKSADVIIYDRLVSSEILELVSNDAKMIFAGKAARNHHMPQKEINHLLTTLYADHKITLRLKGGDPFVFGRGSEEALYLAEHEIPFEIIPGITAAGGSSSYAGIPLTHRNLSRSVQFITGHCQQEKNLDDDIDWTKYSDNDSTLVIYMGLANVEHISQRLIEHGLDEEMPAAIIYSATNNDQDLKVTKLKNLAKLVREYEFKAPSLFIIGKVVSLHKNFQWFNNKINFRKILN